jgi:mannose-6-phosphate isomerase-like protein (cupin superfamily)
MPHSLLRTINLLTVAVWLTVPLARAADKPQPKIVALDKSDNGILPILTGPPETVTMKSGFVVLEPGRSVGTHSTLNHEEILIVLAGQGEMLFHDGSTLPLKARTALYCPPATEHDVKNTGATTLRYIYVVADAK